MNSSLKLTVTLLLAFFAFNIFFSSLKNHRRWENIFVDIQRGKKTKGEKKKIIIKREIIEENDEEGENLDIAIGTILYAIPLFFLLRYSSYFVFERFFLRNELIEPSYDIRHGFLDLKDPLELKEKKERLSSVKKFYNDKSYRGYVNDEVIKIFADIYNRVPSPDNKADFFFLFGLIFLSLYLSLIVTLNVYKYKKQLLSTQKNKHSKKFKFWKKIIFLVIAIAIFVVFVVILALEIKKKLESENFQAVNNSVFPYFFVSKDKKYVDLSDSRTVSFKNFVKFNYAYAKMKKVFEETIGDDFDYFYQKHFERNKKLFNLYEKKKKEEEKITNLDQLTEKNCKEKRSKKRLELERKKKELESLLHGCEAEKKKIEKEIRNIYKKEYLEKKELEGLEFVEEEKIDGMLATLLQSLNHDLNDLDNHGKELKKEKEKKYLDLLYSYKYIQKGIELAKIGIDIFTEDLIDFDNKKDDEYSYFDQDLNYFLKKLNEKKISLIEVYPLKDKNGIIYNSDLQEEASSFDDDEQDSRQLRKELILLSVRIQNLLKEKEQLENLFDEEFFYVKPEYGNIENFYNAFGAAELLNRASADDGNICYYEIRDILGGDNIKRYFEIKKEIQENKLEYLNKFDVFLSIANNDKSLQHQLSDEVNELSKKRNLIGFSDKIGDLKKIFTDTMGKIKNEKKDSYKKFLRNYLLKNDVNEEEASKRLEEISDEELLRTITSMKPVQSKYALYKDGIEDEEFQKIMAVINSGKNDYDFFDANDIHRKCAGLFNFRNFLFLAKVKDKDKNKDNDNALDFEFIFSENELFGSEILFEKIAKVLLAKKRTEINNDLLKKDNDINFNINSDNNDNNDINTNSINNNQQNQQKNVLEMLIEEANYKDKNNEEQAFEFAKNEELSSKDSRYDHEELSKKYSEYKKKIDNLDRDLSFLNQRIRTTLASKYNRRTRELWEAYKEKKKFEKELTEKLEEQKFFTLPKVCWSQEKQSNDEDETDLIKKLDKIHKDEDDRKEIDNQIYKAYKYLKEDFSPEKVECYENLIGRDGKLKMMDNYKQLADNYYLLREQVHNYEERHPDNKEQNSHDKLLELLKRKDKVRERLAKRKSITEIKNYMTKLKNEVSKNLAKKIPKTEKMVEMENIFFLPLLSEKQKLTNKHSQLLEETALQWRINLREINKELKEKKDLLQKRLKKVKEKYDYKEEEEDKKSEENKEDEKKEEEIDIDTKEENNNIDKKNEDNKSSKDNIDENCINNIAQNIFLKEGEEKANSFRNDQIVRDCSKISEEIKQLQKKREKSLTYQLADAAQEIKNIRNSFEEREDKNGSSMCNDFHSFYNNIGTSQKYRVTTNELVMASQKTKGIKRSKQLISNFFDDDKKINNNNINNGNEEKKEEENICFPEELEDRYFLMIDEFDIAKTLLGISSPRDSNFENIIEKLPLKEKERKKRKENKVRKKETTSFYTGSVNYTDLNDYDDELEKMFIT